MSTQIFKRGSKTFFNSSLFFPENIRKQVTIVYAYVRIADDFVDELHQDAKGFKKFVQDTKKCWKGQAVNNEVITNFIELAKQKNFEWYWIASFLDAMESDLHHTKCNTLEETKNYMFGSAEVIGLMMCGVLGLPKKSYPHAQSLGRAFQYINFIRDVQEDIDLGRQYLPQQELDKHDIKGLEEEYTLEHKQAFRAYVRQHINIYLRWQKHGRKGFKYIPRRYRIAIATAADMYHWTGMQIAKNPFIIYSRKVKPSKLRILFMGVKNAIFA